MTCTDSGITRRTALVHVVGPEGTQTEICCADNFAHNFDNTEVTEQKCQNGTVLFRTARLTSEITFDVYQLASADVLPLIFPNGTVTQIAGTPVAGGIQTVKAGSWSLPDGANTRIRVMLDNGDGTAVTVNSVTGSVDGLLTLTTDYTVETEVICVSKGVEYTISYIELVDPVTNLTTDCQDLEIDVDYTPNAGYTFTIQPGVYSQTPVSLVVYAYDLNDPTDIEITYIDKAYFNFSGPVIQYGDPEAEIEAIGVSISIPDDATITMEVQEALLCGVC